MSIEVVPGYRWRSWWGCGGARSCLGGVAQWLLRHKGMVVAAAVVAGAVKLACVLRTKKLRAKWNAVGHNVVVLHTIPCGNVSPSIIPFTIKLETFFRMMDIKYEVDLEMPRSSKGKVPWITLNGEDYTDSELIVQRLQVLFNKFPDAEVPREQRAVGLAMQIMLEEHLYWGLISFRFCEDNIKGLQQVQDVELFMLPVLKIAIKRFRHTLYLQGLGRHSTEEFHSLMKRDMEALSAYLGEKDFLYGDDPHVVDCAVFGILTQFLYNSPGSPYTRWMNEDFPNLRAYTERMRQRFWPDWNKCIKKPGLTL